MHLQVTLLTTLPAFAASHLALAGRAVLPVVARASLGIPDTLAIFVVALVVFGPKRLPEIGKQIGKLVFEFRRASNDFKLQIEEELRMAEQQDRQKVIDMQAKTTQAASPVALSADTATTAAPSETTVVFPAEGVPVPEPPDRRTSDTTTGESASLTETPPAPAADGAAPLKIQPPSTGTLVSSLPPNHAAKNVMTALPPAEAPSQEPDETISTDSTVHNG